MTATRLLPLLRDIDQAVALTPAQWDDTVRLARQSRLLGLIAHRLRDRDDLWRALFPAVRGHLQAAIHYSTHRAQMVRLELDAIDAALPAGRRMVILKGAAYLLQGLEFARGRIPNDVDLMVPAWTKPKRHSRAPAGNRKRMMPTISATTGSGAMNCRPCAFPGTRWKSTCTTPSRRSPAASASTTR